MKRLILAEILLLFLATTFKSDSTGGWVQQTIPIGNKLITDLQFIDSSNGWVVTNWGPAFDTAYVFHTTDSGNNWSFQYKYPASFTAISMVNDTIGYICGGSGFGKIFKTINGGLNWNLITTLGHTLTDISFINKDTGWVCDNDDTFGAGLLKTTNGGVNWAQELTNVSAPSKLFFLNKDTGWVICQTTKLLKTTNSGVNWNQIYAFPGNLGTALFFVNKDTGFVSGGGGSSVIQRTTNGGFNWTNTSNNQGGRNIYFVNNSYGWLGDIFSIIQKSTDGGVSWFSQTTPISNNSSIMFADTLRGWAGGNGIVHTMDGGGPPVGIQQIGNEIPKDYALYQNYPNPFNPSTNIKYQITLHGKSKKAEVKIIVYNIQGKEIETLVNEGQNAGTYQVDFDGTSLPSGVYFYNLIVEGNIIDTKKMILLK